MQGGARFQTTAEDQRRFRDALGRFATGVTVVTTMSEDQVHGMTANGFMSVSLDPPLVVVSIAKRARMHDLLLETRRYGVSVLSDEQDHLSRHFAGRPVDELEIPFVSIEGVPLIEGSLAQVAAAVTDAHAAGDHTLFVGEVLHFDRREGRPLIFHSGSYRNLVERYGDPTHSEVWSGFCLDPLGLPTGGQAG